MGKFKKLLLVAIPFFLLISSCTWDEYHAAQQKCIDSTYNETLSKINNAFSYAYSWIICSVAGWSCDQYYNGNHDRNIDYDDNSNIYTELYFNNNPILNNSIYSSDGSLVTVNFSAKLTGKIKYTLYINGNSVKNDNNNDYNTLSDQYSYLVNFGSSESIVIWFHCNSESTPSTKDDKYIYIYKSSISVNPVYIEIDDNGTQVFTASENVDWSINDTSLGYFSPTSGISTTFHSQKFGSGVIQAASTAFPNIIGYASIDIYSSTLPSVSISVDKQVVYINEKIIFSQIVRNVSGTETIKWFVNNGSGYIEDSSFNPAGQAWSTIGNYKIKAKLYNGSTLLDDSNEISVSIKPLSILIQTQPSSVNKPVGNPFSLTVNASIPSGLLIYQWYKDNVIIPGATAATCNITSAVASDAGNYYVRISDSASRCSPIDSVTVTVTLTDPLLAVSYQPIANQLFGFDDNTSPNWKSIGVGSIDTIQTTITPINDARLTYFTSSASTIFTASPDNASTPNQIVSINGKKNGTGILQSRNGIINGTVVSELNIISLKPKTKTVGIRVINLGAGATYPYTSTDVPEADIQACLNNIVYKQAVFSWVITKLPAMNINFDINTSDGLGNVTASGIPDGKLDMSSGHWRSAEMDIIIASGDDPNYDYIVFLVNNADNANLFGGSYYGQRFAFVFPDSSPNPPTTIAHELGHAAFSLIDNPFGVGNVLDNLMTQGSQSKWKLFKFQWDKINY